MRRYGLFFITNPRFCESLPVFTVMGNYDIAAGCGNYLWPVWDLALLDSQTFPISTQKYSSYLVLINELSI